MATWSKTWYENRKKQNKYKASRVIVDDIVFDSGREAKRYNELKLLEKEGYIKDLRRQVKYILIPAQKDENGKCLERECSYYADFVYVDNDTGNEVVEDTKGMRTKDYIIKRKLMLYIHKIKIWEI